MRIREFDGARRGEVEAVAAIYAHYVANGTASFELEPPDAEEMARRFRVLREGGYPVLVAEGEGGEVLGYAYCRAYHERAAYRHTVEDSVYVRADAVGRGVGRALLEALIGAAARRGFLQMVAAIGDSDNSASVGLHRACGFVLVGTAEKVGFKFGRFLDVVYMQLSLRPGD